MSNRRVDQGRETENAAVAVLQTHGFPYAERRAKRGGKVDVPCAFCGCTGMLAISNDPCPICKGLGRRFIPCDAGDIAGTPGIVWQVKHSLYRPLPEFMEATERQRLAADERIGVLVVKRHHYGAARAGEWDAYLTLEALLQVFDLDPLPMESEAWRVPVKIPLAPLATLLSQHGYGFKMAA